MSADLLSYVERPNLPHVVTKDTQATDDWRRQHLDAAQWPAACGYDLTLEPVELFAQLTGVAPLSDVDEVAVALEQGMREICSRRIGREIGPSPTFLHPRHEWSSATLHGLCDDGGGFIFAAAFIDDSEFGAPPLIESWGDGAEDVPVRVLVRAMGTMTIVRAWQMMHLPTQLMMHVHVAGLVGGTVQMRRVAWDEDLARRLFDRAARFWAGVKVDRPPPARDTEAFYEYLQKKYPTHTPKKWIDVDEQLHAAVIGWSRIDKQIQDLKRDRHAAKNEICDRIRDAEGVRGVDENGVPWRLPWRGVKGPRTLNRALLEETLKHLLGDDETMRIIERCMRQGEGYRKLGPYWQPKPKATIDDVHTVLGEDE